jgi:tripartite-type tricarboxylate transporter receptor subunit TctC
MRLSRRKFLHAAAGAAVVPGAAGIVSASGYPTRPVRLIIGYPPGGSADMTARLTCQWLSERVNRKGSLPVKPAMADQRPTYTNYKKE